MKNAKSNIDIITKIFLLCGTIGSFLFMLVFLIEGAMRSEYNPFRHPISSLSIGDDGWIQVANFIISGILVLMFAIGLRRLVPRSKQTDWGSLLIALVAIGLIGAGIFITDPVYGYPENQPLILAQYTVHGHLHDFFSILVFTCEPAACFIFRRRFIASGKHGWAIYSVFTGIAVPVTFVIAGMGFKQYPGLVDFAGVFQRLSVCSGSVWMGLLALQFFKNPAPVIADI